MDAYGLSDRQAILPALQPSKLIDAERVKYWPIGAADAATALEHLAQQLRWLQSISANLANAL